MKPEPRRPTAPAAAAINDRKLFIEWISEKYPELSESARGRLLGYGDLVLEAGIRMGLVSRGDLGRFFMRHLRESSAPELTERLAKGIRVLDVGSGGGLPGIALAILRPDLRLTLVEPRHRRAAFLERVVLQLGLSNVEVRMASLDAFAREWPGARFDLAVSRAVGWTEPMVAILRRILEPEGVLIRYGAPGATIPGVESAPIDSESPRAVQVWPRKSWGALPGTR